MMRTLARRIGALKLPVCFVLASLSPWTLYAASYKLVEPECPFCKADPSEKDLTKEVMLLGDNQQHALFGTGQLKTSQLVDLCGTSVTIRPVQQDLFALDVLGKVIASEGKPFIHLGDLMDVSCRLEHVKAMRTLGAATQEWVAGLGNHDGYFVGNFVHTGLRSDWAGLCDSGRYYDHQDQRLTDPEIFRDLPQQDYTFFTKSMVIRNYMAAVNRPPLTAQGSQVPATGEWNNPSEGIVRRIAWNLHDCGLSQPFQECNPQQSFLLQLLRLPAAEGALKSVYVVLLDTSSYTDTIGYSGALAGIHASILPSQWEIIERWAKEAYGKRDIVIFAGHHPYDEWDSASKQRMMTLVQSLGGSSLYISAHTHIGAWRLNGKRGPKLIELNVGSMTDAPVHFRTLKLTSRSDGHIGVVSQYRGVRQLLSDAHACDGLKYPKGDEPHSVVKQEGNHHDIFDYQESMKRRVLAGLYVYRDLLSRFSDPDIGQVQFNTPLESDTDQPKVVRFASVEELSKQIGADISTLTRQINEGKDSDTRSFSRLVLTLGRIRLKGTDQAALDNYKMCQAVQAAEDDLAFSPHCRPDHLPGEVKATEASRSIGYLWF